MDPPTTTPGQVVPPPHTQSLSGEESEDHLSLSEPPHQLHSFLLSSFWFHQRHKRSSSGSLSSGKEGERERGKVGEGEGFGTLKMPVENESWGPAQGEIQRRNTSALE